MRQGGEEGGEEELRRREMEIEGVTEVMNVIHY